jgi:hypothetical protein
MPEPLYVTYFEKLAAAFRGGNVALAHCVETDGSEFAFACSESRLPDGTRELLPLAYILKKPLPPFILPPDSGAQPAPFSAN